jgi:hypothetical protein
MPAVVPPMPIRLTMIAPVLPPGMRQNVSLAYRSAYLNRATITGTRKK